MAEDVSIQLDFSPISIDTQYLTLNHAINWLINLEWWEWLILLKIGFVFWVLNVTVILPSLYMQVLLYTDEMTPRRLQPSPPAVDEMARTLSLGQTRFSFMQRVWLHRRRCRGFSSGQQKQKRATDARMKAAAENVNPDHDPNARELNLPHFP
ncbi:uncharacterized protein [Penaeus vannamei]|uniref:uncharacterized protein isoform X2 n=1 Tax=Penaeus vannamei TaxID=6689 RepID=UPI00387F8719